MWGGRFEGEPDALFRAFNDSLPIDWRLVHEDIAGSIAWAWALAKAGVLSKAEATELESALRDLDAEAASMPGAPIESGAEDVHSWVETKLVEKLGVLGKKLHTGRSRNDQVATDLRLWTKAAIGARVAEIADLIAALAAIGEREIGTPFPAYTHLQPAQPVLFAHWCLAHAEALKRDAGRFTDSLQRTDACPLGSAALAGTAYDIDREALATSLGFAAPTANSLDAVGDRDFVIEALSAAATCAMHLSRLAEELIVYSSAEFGLVQLDDSVTSGSSIMPQKKNPDAMELVRAKCGSIVGAHTGLLMTLKGLPGAYNKDLQEDKAPLFAAMDTLSMCLKMSSLVVSTMKVNVDACRTAAMAGYSNATELADYLVSKGVAFRDAHEIVGGLVRQAMGEGKPLEDLTLGQLKAACALIEDDVFEALSLEAALARRDVVGGTAPSRVKAALAEIQLKPPSTPKCGIPNPDAKGLESPEAEVLSR
jgi:argininosuccinate lyase